MDKLKKPPGPPPEGYPYHLKITLSPPVMKGGNLIGQVFSGWLLAGISMAYKLEGLSRVMRLALKGLGISEGQEPVDVQLSYSKPEDGGAGHHINVYYKDEDLALANCQDIIRERDETMGAPKSELTLNPIKMGHRAFYDMGGYIFPEVIHEGQVIFSGDFFGGEG